MSAFLSNLPAYLRAFCVRDNAMLAVVLLVALWFLVSASRKEQYRMAWRQIRGKFIPMASMAVLGLYILVAILDSIAWSDRSVDPDGRPMCDTSGVPLYENTPLSILDRLATPMRTNTEKTFSAPFADEQFTKETVPQADGTSGRINPSLRHPGSHIMGTDKVGNDVFFQGVKGIRTAVIVGGLTTLIVIPFAVFFGVIAGYFGKWVDDAIQYSYSTLASIPNVLLIVSFMLLTGQGLMQLCIILGITNWTNLCRFLRGETLKLRELDYVQAAEAFGVGRIKIIYRHIVPNLMHIVLIASVLRFSALVLAEAVLTYIGIGVGPETGSWGTMINSARLELTREPVVWWNLMAAFGFMLGLILSANLFGDALRDALDPKMKTR